MYIFANCLLMEKSQLKPFKVAKRNYIIEKLKLFR